MADLTIAQGDYGFTLDFTVQTGTGGAYVLTGKVVTLKVWAPGNPGVLKLSASTTLVSATSGTCQYSPASTDFTATGHYYMELEMTEATQQDSTKSYTLDVVESA